MFDELLEKIKRADEIEYKLLSIFEGKTWEQVFLLRHLSQRRVLKEEVIGTCKDVSSIEDIFGSVSEFARQVELHGDEFVYQGVRVTYDDETDIHTFLKECVCHVYGLSDRDLLEFYGSMGNEWKAYNEPYGSDKAEVEAEITKRGLDVRADGTPFSMVPGIQESIGEFFEKRADGKSKERLIAHAISRFGESKLSNVLQGVSEPDDTYITKTKYYELIKKARRDFKLQFTDYSDEQIEKLVTEYATALARKTKANESNLKEKERLSPKQEEILKKFEPEKEYSAYAIGSSLGTLNALARKGYLTRKSGLGSMAFPTSSIMFKLKEGLVSHAQRELKLAGMFDDEVDGSEAMGDWNRLCAEAVIELMEVFAEQGHSGFSASMTQELFSRLSKFEALTELTDNSDEWNDISEMQNGEPGWQSQRNPSCFSEDGGKTYWDINEDWNKHEDEDGIVWSGGGTKEEWDNRPMHQSKHIEKKE